jgi:hypothetical protein
LLRLRFGRSLTLPKKSRLVGRAKLRLSRDQGCPNIFSKNLVSRVFLGEAADIKVSPPVPVRTEPQWQPAERNWVFAKNLAAARTSGYRVPAFNLGRRQSHRRGLACAGAASRGAFCDLFSAGPRNLRGSAFPVEHLRRDLREDRSLL